MRAMIKVKAAILSIAMLQMITSGLTPGLSALAEAFPDRSALEIQLTVSCIGVIVLLMSLITDRIYAALTRRRSVILALGMMAAVGLAAWLYHPSLEMMYVYSGLLGLSLALYIPAVGSVIIDCFQGEERAKLTGSQSSFCSLGGIVISFVGGMLAAVHWFSVYLVFLLVLPALLLTILYFPKDSEKKTAEFSKGEGGTGKEKRRVSGDILLYGGICLAFVAIYSACGNNLSMFVAEEGMGSTVLSGALGSIGMAGGVAGGLLFGRYLSRYRERLFPAIFALEALGFAVLAQSTGIAAVAATVFLLGLIQCVMMPCCLLTLSERVPASQAVLASSVICAVAPNLSGVLSPLVITNLSELLFAGSVRGRFAIAAALAAVMAAATIRTAIKRKDCEKNRERR